MTALGVSEPGERLRAGATGREGLVARVCATLRQQIRDGEVALGARLPGETELAKALQVSRPTLREAVRILAQEGLLAVRHGVGDAASSDPHSPIGRGRAGPGAGSGGGGRPEASRRAGQRHPRQRGSFRSRRVAALDTIASSRTPKGLS